MNKHENAQVAANTALELLANSYEAALKLGERNPFVIVPIPGNVDEKVPAKGLYYGIAVMIDDGKAISMGVEQTFNILPQDLDKVKRNYLAKIRQVYLEKVSELDRILGIN